MSGVSLLQRAASLLYVCMYVCMYMYACLHVNYCLSFFTALPILVCSAFSFSLFLFFTNVLTSTDDVNGLGIRGVLNLLAFYPLERAYLLVKDSMFRIITDDAPESRTSLRLFRIIKIPYILFTRYTFSIEHIFHPPPTTFGYRETQAYAVAPLPRNVEFGRVRRMVLLLLGVRMVRRLVFSVRAVQQHTLSGCIIHLSLCNIPQFPWFCGESSSRTSREVSLHRAFFCLLF